MSTKMNGSSIDLVYIKKNHLIKLLNKCLSYDPYSPAHVFNSKTTYKVPYERCTYALVLGGGGGGSDKAIQQRAQEMHMALHNAI